MGFTTEIFLFVFFPACFFLYFLIDRISAMRMIGKYCRLLRMKEIVLICFSIGFYMWASFEQLAQLLVYIPVVYGCGVCVERFGRGTDPSRVGTDDKYEHKKIEWRVGGALVLLFALVFIIGCLVYFNYLEFLFQWQYMLTKVPESAVETASDLIGSNEIQSPLIPVGLSFVTFSAVSYIVDIYRGDAKPGSLIDCALYLTFFPKMISGPIMQWKHFGGQIRSMTFRFDTAGINRIMIGFGKKVILADTFGLCLADMKLLAMDRVMAIGAILLYMLQIYYDFSGYSDIAIGLLRIFGFDCPENFNFPYLSRSISEFWRRWHISLGTWFREYVYIPLGGSRKGLIRTLVNLGVVFVLTGIWHGVWWNYIVWGCVNGLCTIIERILKGTVAARKTPEILKYILTMFIVMLCWQLFRYEEQKDLIYMFDLVLGNITNTDLVYTWQHYFDLRLLVFTCIGVLGATVAGMPRIVGAYRAAAATKTGYVVQELVLLLLFVTAIICMINSTYSPFIYFQY